LESGDLETSVLIVLSDHGFRFGSFPQTDLGRMENNLPFLFIAFPTWFHKRFPSLVANVVTNSRRLTTPFDLHKTLQHLLHLQTNVTPWSNNAGYGSQKAFSLLTNQIPKNRSCKDAGIPDAFCSCNNLVLIDPQEYTAKHAGAKLVEKLNAALKNVSDICSTLILAKVEKAMKLLGREKYVIHVKTLPQGIFIGWIEFHYKLMRHEGGNNHNNMKNGDRGENLNTSFELMDVDRLDSYGDTSSCVMDRDVSLKEICICK